MWLTRASRVIIIVVVTCSWLSMVPSPAPACWPECPCNPCWELQEGPEIEASLCRGDACVDWVITCRQATNPNPPLTTAQQWAEYFRVGHLVEDQDLRQIHCWVYEYNSSGQLECVPFESDWMLINDPYITVHWEFVGDPPDLTVPGTYFLKAIFANDSIPDPILCNPCVCPDGTENCEACQECPARKKPTIRDPDVERLFTIWVVETEIIWPKCPIPVGEGAALSDSFITDNGCYRQSNQAVVFYALGTNQPLARVEGEISPAAFSPWWEIDEHMGFLDPQDAACPDHTPPDEPGTGNIYLYAERCEDRVCVESVSIIVYPDHLARDLANFFPFMRCSPNVPVLTGAAEHFPCTGVTNPGLQLADESCVEGLSLTCGASVSHATIGDHEGWNPVDCFGSQGPYALIDADVNGGVKTWQQFEQMQIYRGDIIQLGWTLGVGYTSIHVSIAIDSGPGWYITTHAGDTMSGIFRRENPDGYYSMRWTYDWSPTKSHIIQGTASLQQWLNQRARLRVWRRNISGE